MAVATVRTSSNRRIRRPPDQRIPFGRAIAALRAMLGVPQGAAAKAAGISHASLARLELARRSPAPGEPERLAAAVFRVAEEAASHAQEIGLDIPAEHPLDRRPRGEEHRLAKLTAEIVRDLRAQHATGRLNQSEAARRLGVSAQAINCVISRKTWQRLM